MLDQSGQLISLIHIAEFLGWTKVANCIISLQQHPQFQNSLSWTKAGILEYPDGSREWLWLPDANDNYLSGKHIPLFIAAVLILLVGLFYTALLGSGSSICRIGKSSDGPGTLR